MEEVRLKISWELGVDVDVDFSRLELG